MSGDGAVSVVHGDTLTVALPDHWTLTQVAEPSLRDAPADWVDRLAVATRISRTFRRGASAPVVGR